MLPLKALVPAFLALHPHSPAKPLDWKGCRQTTLLDPRNPDGFYAIAGRKLALEHLRN
ncbi:hypothetical protein [Labrys sp. WJW]|uniref:hypothetical protein n=1 Tax=Labrys sp. WJW TaxID=1737983 RepID=UPI0012EAA0D0|nr:hypothetical protein [Labrys sp. WJW]